MPIAQKFSRNRLVTMRLTDSEYRRLTRAAEKARCLADHMRQILLDHAAGTLRYDRNPARRTPRWNSMEQV